GYGRGGRMKIETDRVEILSGVRWGETLGSPVTLSIVNRDWENWCEKMSPESAFADDSIRVTCPRPGHADLTGALKYNVRDARNILERSSARETAARVAVGAVAKELLRPFGISINAFVSELGGIKAKRPDMSLNDLVGRASCSELFTYDEQAEAAMKLHIDEMKNSGDSVGGVVEVVVAGAPPGLGSHVQWDRKLDARLAMALMSIQAIKGVEVGIGFAAAASTGSKVHDEIIYDPAGKKFMRRTNRAGGIEGGMSNGEEIVLRAAMKPIPTLYSPLKTVDMDTKAQVEASVERSDVCAVPAASVVAEAVVAFEIACAFMEKFGGDSVTETRRNFDSYLQYVREF
ncbi:MAG TPA: chorismate synthase, partial [Geobacteraceae bacterium]|nr:chorismate synthase [Geobacteraceae bacterium]